MMNKWYPQFILSALAGLMNQRNPLDLADGSTQMGDTNTLANSSIRSRYKHATKASHKEPKYRRVIAAHSRNINRGK